MGASSTPAEVFLPRLAVAFSVRYPEVALDVRVDDTERTLATLLEREVEVAVVGREVDDPRLEGTVVERDELVAVVADTDHPGGGAWTAEELASRPFVMREEGSATRRAAEAALTGAGLAPRVAMELGSNAAVLGAVAAGAGVGVVPARVLGARRDVRRVEVEGLSLSRPFVLAVERGRALSPAAEAFVEVCLRKERA